MKHKRANPVRSNRFHLLALSLQELHDRRLAGQPTATEVQRRVSLIYLLRIVLLCLLLMTADLLLNS